MNPSDINIESATYDSWETDEIMTKQLSEKDDYGEESHRGDPSQAYHDYLGDSQNFSGFPQPVNQEELWNRFKDWNRKKKLQEDKNKVGKERERSNKPGDQPGTMGEGYWSYKNTPYVAPVQSPAFFEAMPAMKLGALSPVSATFTLTPDKIKVECSWEADSISTDLDEVQTLARIVTFLEERLPTDVHIKADRIDLQSRTASISIFKAGER